MGGLGAGQGAQQQAGLQSILTGSMGKLIRYGLKKKLGIELPERGKDLKDAVVISPDQASTSGKLQYVCKKTGRELAVNLPANIRAGQQLRLKGMGEPGQGGAEAGDLYLTVNVRSPLIQKAKDIVDAIRSSIK